MLSKEQALEIKPFMNLRDAQPIIPRESKAAKAKQITQRRTLVSQALTNWRFEERSSKVQAFLIRKIKIGHLNVTIRRA